MGRKAITFQTLKGYAEYDPGSNRINHVPNSEILKTSIQESSYMISDKIQTKYISRFIIEITQDCNMRCSYCCFSGQYKGVRSHRNVAMSQETIEEVIEFISKHHSNKPEGLHVGFYGGESLLRFESIKYIVERLSRIVESKLSFDISTNGLLLTKDVVNWICAHDRIYAHISIDGDKSIHDANRRTASGKGTYDRIKRNLVYFKETFPNEFKERIHILSTAPDIKTIERISEIWSKTYTSEFSPAVSTVTPNLCNYNVDLNNLVKADLFYRKATSEYLKGEDTIMVKCLKSLIKPIEDRRIETRPPEIELETCLNNLDTCFINSEGILYSCEKINDNFIIGDVKNGFDIDKIQLINSLYSERVNKFCSKCWASRLCQRCLVDLNYPEEQHEIRCKYERGKVLLALKYYCLLKDLQPKTDIKAE